MLGRYHEGMGDVWMGSVRTYPKSSGDRGFMRRKRMEEVVAKAKTDTGSLQCAAR